MLAHWACSFQTCPHPDSARLSCYRTRQYVGENSHVEQNQVSYLGSQQTAATWVSRKATSKADLATAAVEGMSKLSARESDADLLIWHHSTRRPTGSFVASWLHWATSILGRQRFVLTGIGMCCRHRLIFPAMESPLVPLFEGWRNVDSPGLSQTSWPCDHDVNWLYHLSHHPEATDL